tara:strand:+ start:225 stop:608 length:384 start_codon:yes stop_codon:yes gene_type:complete
MFDELCPSQERALRYHRKHTTHFSESDDALGLTSGLDAWYKQVSAVVHGQVPGTWHPQQRHLSEIDYSEVIAQAAVSCFEVATTLINKLFLATVAQDLWDGFAVEARRQLLKGLSGTTKSALKLSVA